MLLHGGEKKTQSSENLQLLLLLSSAKSHALGFNHQKWKFGTDRAFCACRRWRPFFAELATEMRMPRSLLWWSSDGSKIEQLDGWKHRSSHEGERARRMGSWEICLRICRWARICVCLSISGSTLAFAFCFCWRQDKDPTPIDSEWSLVCRSRNIAWIPNVTACIVTVDIRVKHAVICVNVRG